MPPYLTKIPLYCIQNTNEFGQYTTVFAPNITVFAPNTTAFATNTTANPKDPQIVPYPLATLKCCHALTSWTCAD